MKWRPSLDPNLRNDLGTALLAFGLTLGCVVLLVAPGVHWLDAGQLTAGAFHLSPAHAPGEPVYVMLTKGISLLPVGNIAFRANLGSSLAAAACAGLVAGFLRSAWRGMTALKPLEGSVLSLLAACASVFSYPLLIQSVRAEVYALHLLMALGATLAAFRAGLLRSGPLEARYVAMSAFLAGLDFGVHTLLAVLAFLPVLVLALFRPPSFRVVMTAAWAGLLGCSSYLMLPIRATSHAGFGWGDAAHLEGFLDVLLARTFQQNFSPLTASLLGHNLGIAGDVILSGVGPGILALAAQGVMALLVLRQGRVLAFVALMPLFNLLSVLPQNKVFRDNPDLAGYLAVNQVLLIALAAHGIAFLLSRLPSRFAVARLALVTAFAALAGVPLAATLEAGDRSEDYLPEDHLRAALQSLPPGAVFLASGNDTMFLLQYAQEVEATRPDVTVLPRALLTHPWYQRRRRLPLEMMNAAVQGVGAFLPLARGRAVRVELRDRDLPFANALCPAPKPGWGFYDVAPCPWLETGTPPRQGGLLQTRDAVHGPQALPVGLNAAAYLADFYRARGKSALADAVTLEAKAFAPDVAWPEKEGREVP